MRVCSVHSRKCFNRGLKRGGHKPESLPCRLIHPLHTIQDSKQYAVVQCPGDGKKIFIIDHLRMHPDGYDTVIYII